MDKEEAYFHAIAESLCKKYKQVIEGKMMSSPGILYKKKVFAFYHNKEMIFKLGKEFDPKKENLNQFSYLQPFKTKAPMKAWFVIPYAEKKKWEKLAQLALEKISK